MNNDPRPYRLTCGTTARLGVALIALAFCVRAPGASAAGFGAEGLDEPVRVAVYDQAPYGSVDAQGLFSGVSVDLRRRVAEDLALPYRLTAVPQMEAVLSGLEHGQFDVAIGAITITPDRLTRVDFSYPAHRFGVAVAFRRSTGPLAALAFYGDAVRQHATLIEVTSVLLLLTGALVWRFERRQPAAQQRPESAVVSLLDGVYWAVVTMTTVGYGDKTPKTGAGRVLAVVWMLASLALISLVSTSLVSSMTAARLETGPLAHDGDLVGQRLAAVTDASGAEFLQSRHLPFVEYRTLQEALAALAARRVDAVVNSVGALQYLVATRFRDELAMSRGLLAPAYMAFALPPASPLKKPLDRAMVKITASPSWRSLAESYFDQ